MTEQLEFFRCWLARHGRSEWVLIQGTNLADATVKAEKKYKHRLVSVKAIPKRTAA